jgi:hypothetical protein
MKILSMRYRQRKLNKTRSMEMKLIRKETIIKRKEVA